MRQSMAGLLLAAAALLAGCATAPQTAVPLQPEAIKTAGTKVGVVLSVVPKPDTYFPGAACLLCMATASVANSALTTQVRTWPTQDLAQLRDDLAKLLRARGAEVVVLPQDVDLAKLPDRSAKEPNRARKDFSALALPQKVDKLLVVQIDAVGATRNYASYVPTGEPRATVTGAGYLVDLGTHTLEWYEPISISVNASGTWDEPPKYPGLTNAYFQAIEQTMDRMRQPFGGK